MSGRHPGHGYIRENRGGFTSEGQEPVPAGELKLPLTLRQLGYTSVLFPDLGPGEAGAGEGACIHDRVDLEGVAPEVPDAAHQGEEQQEGQEARRDVRHRVDGLVPASLWRRQPFDHQYSRDDEEDEHLPPPPGRRRREPFAHFPVTWLRSTSAKRTTSTKRV